MTECLVILLLTREQEWKGRCKHVYCKRFFTVQKLCLRDGRVWVLCQRLLFLRGHFFGRLAREPASKQASSALASHVLHTLSPVHSATGASVVIATGKGDTSFLFFFWQDHANQALLAAALLQGAKGPPASATPYSPLSQTCNSSETFVLRRKRRSCFFVHSNHVTPQMGAV